MQIITLCVNAHFWIDHKLNEEMNITHRKNEDEVKLLKQQAEKHVSTNRQFDDQNIGISYGNQMLI